MACHKGEYAKIQACNSDADCIAQVKADITSCMAACPPTTPPVGDMVKGSACEKCMEDYKACLPITYFGYCHKELMDCLHACSEAKVAGAKAEAKSVSEVKGSESACEKKCKDDFYNTCLQITYFGYCHKELMDCLSACPEAKVAAEVTGVEPIVNRRAAVSIDSACESTCNAALSSCNSGCTKYTYMFGCKSGCTDTYNACTRSCPASRVTPSPACLQACDIEYQHQCSNLYDFDAIHKCQKDTAFYIGICKDSCSRRQHTVKERLAAKLSTQRV